MNEHEGVGEEDVAIGELERKEWEKKEELCQEGSRSTGEDFCSNLYRLRE